MAVGVAVRLVFVPLGSGTVRFLNTDSDSYLDVARRLPRRAPRHYGDEGVELGGGGGIGGVRGRRGALSTASSSVMDAAGKTFRRMSTGESPAGMSFSTSYGDFSAGAALGSSQLFAST